jgi:DNA-binding MarR family transcriptional regulator
MSSFSVVASATYRTIIDVATIPCTLNGVSKTAEELVDDDRITVVGLLAEAKAAVGCHLEQELAAEGLPITWYEVLVRLGRTPGGRLRMSDLAHAVSLTTSGTTRLVDRIEAAGLIERQPCPSDRRVAYAVLTDAGREVLARTTPVHVDGIQRHVIDVLSDDEVATLERLLRKIRDANWSSATPPSA